jgi:hypothetical protein
LYKNRSIAIFFVNYQYKQIKGTKTETVSGTFQASIRSQHFQFQTTYNSNGIMLFLKRTEGTLYFRNINRKKIIPISSSYFFSAFAIVPIPHQ